MLCYSPPVSRSSLYVYRLVTHVLHKCAFSMVYEKYYYMYPVNDDPVNYKLPAWGICKQPGRTLGKQP